MAKPYPLGGTDVEKERLLRQARSYEPHTKRLLDEIGLQAGARCVDVGCGPIGILDALAERVGPQGIVVGLEREPRFVAMAEEEIARRGFNNVRIVQADALETGLEKAAYDLVHERLVLVNVADRAGMVAEMLSLIRPGGTIALEDIDNVSWVCEPSHPAWDAFVSAFHRAFHAGGGDGFLGRRLPHILQEAGVDDVHTRLSVEVAPVGDYRRTHLISLIDSLRETILRMGLFSEAQLAAHRAALTEHLDDPRTTVIDKLFIQCWGRKR